MDFPFNIIKIIDIKHELELERNCRAVLRWTFNVEKYRVVGVDVEGQIAMNQRTE